MSPAVRPSGRRRALGRVAASLLPVLLIWALFTWPLPRYAASGIPSSSQNVERGGVRAMISGDHLQLLYHFELVQDFLTGRVPWFHNVYEFNTGDDSERRLPGSYFAPVSVLYALLAGVAPPAAAWNLVGFLSLWATFAATWVYVRRFVRTPAAAAFGALLSVLLPYRWVNLLGGSPTGFAMMWTPLAALGVDGIVRTGRMRDGWIAAAALLFLCWGDLQTFFFTVLSLPFWALLAALDTDLFRGLRWRDLSARLPACGAAASGLALAAVYRAVRHAHLAASEMAGGRGLGEVRGFSPSVRGFWQWAAEGLQSHVYLGFTAALVLAGAVLAALARGGRDEPRLRRWVPAAGLVAAAGILALALGVQGPFGGLAIRWARAAIPPYAMVRQTAKIFALLPTLLALLGGVAADRLAHRLGVRRWAVTALALLAASGLAVGEYKAQVRATVSLLEVDQEAYAAVARDAAARREREPRALVLPIWPGEAAEASVYQFHAQRYGIRLVNGYSPVVSRAYVRDVFHPLQSVNQGGLGEPELRLLDDMGVRYAILHEDLFPEKVSPFPVTFTRDRLMAHPRLAFLGRDGPVWSFRLLDAPRDPPPAPRSPGVRFPTRRIPFERLGDPEDRRSDPDSSGGGTLALRPGAAEAVAGPWRVVPDDSLAWYVRVRGEGTLAARTLWDEETAGESVAAVDAPEWTWVALPLPALPSFGPVHAAFRATDGEVEADLGFLIAGRWDPDLAPGEARVFEAADFFHAGYSEWETQSVVFRPERDPDAAVFYGPRLPLAPGRYRLDVEWRAEAKPGTEIGRLNVRLDDADAGGWVAFRAGEPFRIEWDQPVNLPVTWVFHYLRSAPAEIRSLTLRRLADAEEQAAAGP